MLNIITKFLISTEVTEIHKETEVQKYNLNRRTQSVNDQRKDADTGIKHKTTPE